MSGLASNNESPNALAFAVCMALLPACIVEGEVGGSDDASEPDTSKSGAGGWGSGPAATSGSQSEAAASSTGPSDSTSTNGATSGSGAAGGTMNAGGSDAAGGSMTTSGATTASGSGGSAPCVPNSSCQSRGYECGSYKNNCGDTVNCGSCSQGTCGLITPRACDVSHCDLQELASIPHGKVIITKGTSPTNEYIFPALTETKSLDGATKAYHLYYAPHDGWNGGNGLQGIVMATANSPTGPWTKENVVNGIQQPIVPNKWGTVHNVSHISSPHPMIGDNRVLRLFYHGENSVSRIANSNNGSFFTGPILNAATTNEVLNASNLPGLAERSYARVFRHRMPSKNNRYTMLFMGNKNGTRGVYMGWSNNLTSWSFQATAVLAPTVAEGGQIAGPFLIGWRGRTYIIYHKSGGTSILAAEVDSNLKLLKRCGAIFSANAGAPENGRAAQPFIYDTGKQLVVFYDASAIGSQILQTTRSLPGAIVADNTSASFQGSWATGSTTAGYQGSNYRHDGNAGKGNKTATYKFNIASSGFYRVQAKWPDHNQRATNIPVSIVHAGGTAKVTVNQRYHGGQWFDLGFYRFVASKGATVILSNAGTSNYVVADAIRLLPH